MLEGQGNKRADFFISILEKHFGGSKGSENGLINSYKLKQILFTGVVYIIACSNLYYSKTSNGPRKITNHNR